MPKCAVCGREVKPGTGTYRYGRLVHKSCAGMAKIHRYKIRPKPKRKKKSFFDYF